MLASVSKIRLFYGGISQLFIFWSLGKYETDSSLMGTCSQEYYKSILSWLTHKRCQEHFWWVCLSYTLLFSHSQNPGKQETGERLFHSWSKVAWRFNGRTWFLMASPSDPGFSLWATLTLVSQGHTLKNPGSMRWGEGRLERTRSYFNMIKCLPFGKLTFLFLFFIFINVNMACHSSEMI